MNQLFNQMNAYQPQGNSQLNMLLSMVRMKNPEVYNQFQKLYQSGQNPEAIAKSMLSQLDQGKLSQFKNLLSSYGIPGNILK